MDRRRRGRAGTIRRDMPLWAQLDKHAVYQVIPDVVHNANQDNSVFTNQAILAFLRALKGPMLENS